MRPIQFIESLQDSRNATLSTIGIGWHVKTHLNWFDKTIDITEFKAKPTPIVGRKMKNLCKAQESVWINKTLAKVSLVSDFDNVHVYSIICDVKQALLKDPTLSVGWYKVFFDKPEFVCSHQMILSLPFDFVKKLTVGVETNLPRDLIKSVRNDALRAETNHKQSIRLWRSIAIDLSYKKRRNN
jgi:hypothetical protein